MNIPDVETAIEYVKKIIDNVRCGSCDKIEGTRLRYSCGHTACENCVVNATNCQICMSPPQNFRSEPKPDYPLTSTAKHATDLLKACQNLLEVKAFQQKRISEQLKIEKELFPKCIQAPLKYENKRKSTKLSYKSKENRFSTYFPGETILAAQENKMDNSVNYVQQWLNTNEKNLARKPFADINVNTQCINNSNKASLQNLSDNMSLGAKTKRSHVKLITDVNVNTLCVNSKNTITQNVSNKDVSLSANRKRSHVKPFTDFNLNTQCVNNSKKAIRQNVINKDLSLGANSKRSHLKPFIDLNVNTQCENNSNKAIIQHVSNKDVPLGANRKRSYFKTAGIEFSLLDRNRQLSYESDSTPKKIKKDIYTSYQGDLSSDIQKNCDDNDESGIFMDNHPIVVDDSQETVIDDSQETLIDKDKKAWLAVLKACENEENEVLESTSLVNSSQVNITNDSSRLLNNTNAIETKGNNVLKVPFLKKSAIIETCRYCKGDASLNHSMPVTSPSKSVTITIDGDNFLTTITILKNVQNNLVMNTTNNASVQTNTCDMDPIDNNQDCNEGVVREDESVIANDKLSEDLFADDRKIFADVYENTEINKCIIIEESDSDTDLEVSGPLSVKADVHRSCLEPEYGILTEIKNIKKHEIKSRRGPRGHTPTSTDSSEKENYNPNRTRKQVSGKKKFTKK